jgi:hypothetical protein
VQVSVVLGILLLTGLDLECSGAANVETCAITQDVYAVIMALGSSTVGLFAVTSTLLMYFTAGGRRPDPAKEEMQRKLAL